MVLIVQSVWGRGQILGNLGVGETFEPGPRYRFGPSSRRKLQQEDGFIKGSLRCLFFRLTSWGTEGNEGIRGCKNLVVRVSRGTHNGTTQWMHC